MKLLEKDLMGNRITLKREKKEKFERFVIYLNDEILWCENTKFRTEEKDYELYISERSSFIFNELLTPENIEEFRNFSQHKNATDVEILHQIAYMSSMNDEYSEADINITYYKS